MKHLYHLERQASWYVRTNPGPPYQWTASGPRGTETGMEDLKEEARRRAQEAFRRLREPQEGWDPT